MLFSAGQELKYIFFYCTIRAKKVTTSGKYHNTYHGPGRTGNVYTRQCEENAKSLKYYKVTKFILGIGKIPTSFDFGRGIPLSRWENSPEGAQLRSQSRDQSFLNLCFMEEPLK
jgi:hypothetical protein